MVVKRTIERDRPAARYEAMYWRCGYRHVAGVDEVGRGALAGPLLSAAIVLDPRSICARDRNGLPPLAALRDSKLLSPMQREEFAVSIAAHALAIGLGQVEAEELDAIGVAAANRLAMERAVLNLSVEPDALILDAFTTDLPLPQVGVIHGDALSYSVAAASIYAKVTRDRIMAGLEMKDSRYSFSAHKGYGTAKHLHELASHGPGPAHRRCFSPVGRLCG